MPGSALMARIRSRRTLALAVALLLGGLGLLALTQLLREVHFQQIRTAWAAIGAGRFAIAILLTIVSYLALTCYDVLALRAVGRPLRYRVAALASFTSYAIGNNLGLSFLTGGSARYRVYSAEGLGVGDVARVVALASLAFWTGLLLLAGALLASGLGQPALFGAQPPPWAARVLGLLLLLVPLFLLLWTGRNGRTLRLGRFHLLLPGRRLAAAQMLVAIVDLASSSMVLLALVPGAGLAEWPAFFVGYVLAVVLALVSAVPGGVGVFEAVLLAALPALGRPELVAALLGYRLVYYLLPLLLAGVLVVAGEGERLRHPATTVLRGTVLRGGQAVVAALAPLLAAALTFAGGLCCCSRGRCRRNAGGWPCSTSCCRCRSSKCRIWRPASSGCCCCCCRPGFTAGWTAPPFWPASCCWRAGCSRCRRGLITRKRRPCC